MPLPPLLIRGMHGMGDNLHQRAFIRQLIDQDRDVYLETSWPCIYHDLVAKRNLHFCQRRLNLRTQVKNIIRESGKYTGHPGPNTPSVRPYYTGAMVRNTPRQMILEAMFESLPGLGLDISRADFRLPIPEDWAARANALFQTDKPICVYRPLVIRPEWRGAEKRNADPVAYTEIFAAIRDRFFVVSVADLEPLKEWVIGPRLRADIEFHKGELPFEVLAGLFNRADLVYTSSGFAVLLAQAVSTPSISVVGLYERACHHFAGKDYAPHLGIEPIKPCDCQFSQCNFKQCSKRIDIPAAIANARAFVDSLGISATAESRPFNEIYDIPDPALTPRMPARRLVRPWDEANANRPARVRAQIVRRQGVKA